MLPIGNTEAKIPDIIGGVLPTLAWWEDISFGLDGHVLFLHFLSFAG
nr:MAG TPA: hypothetical protein [Caudoviricetes sp.]